MLGDFSDLIMIFVRVGLFAGLIYYLYKMDFFKKLPDIMEFVGKIMKGIFYKVNKKDSSDSGKIVKKVGDYMIEEDKEISKTVKENKEKLEEEVKKEIEEIKNRNIESKKGNYRKRAENLKLRWKNKNDENIKE